MCVVSMVGDHYTDKWRPLSSFDIQQARGAGGAGGAGGGSSGVIDLAALLNPVNRAEFEALKKEVLEMKELLKRAKIYDEQTGQKYCEMESKIAMLRQVAEAVGVNLDEVFGPKPGQT